MPHGDLYFNYLETPIGELEICCGKTELISILFSKTQKHELNRQIISENKIITETKKQLNAYFKKQITVFDLPLKLNGTDFQNKVWNELIKISFAKTIDYLTLAKNLGDAKCIRAAATANGKNPISIIIPCHRVIGTNDNLVGYSGDLWRKKWLLEHESNQSKLF